MDELQKQLYERNNQLLKEWDEVLKNYNKPVTKKNWLQRLKKLFK